MPRIQVTFKNQSHDITIEAQSIDSIIEEYEKVRKKLGLLTSEPPKRGGRKARSGLRVQIDTDSIPSKIVEMKEEGFFRTERTIQQVQERLAEKGVSKKVTSLSGPLQKLVKSKVLKRRYKKDDSRKILVYFS